MNSRTFILALAIAVTPGIATAASVYKWTDENGITHFGDRQPTGKNAETVNVRTGSPAAASKRQSPQDRVESMAQEQEQTAEQERLSAQEEARQKQRKANCETARSNLSILRTSSRIRIEEDGQQRYLSAEEIEEQRVKFQEIADQNCDPEPTED